ncbi:copper resistance protein CopC/CopD [Paenibacillus alginolyticus]|uniref:copper resistance CopC/CopD family protein n=1 Tax=Paenibacillus alginolyticus TaxID=59839 RepID=UPI00040713F3|nr:copper resistance protein CopC [Paenibacillus alginolyticus]MCY9670607.1 copper resistance protein CopC/CopD [Paenibacillus alginolyticus]
MGVRTMQYSNKLWRVIINMAIFLCLIVPNKTFAHSTLVDAIPAPNSSLSELPSNITLTFNESLERELFQLKLFDKTGKSISKDAPQISEDQRQLTLHLPTLNDGVYTVSYKILSADGHPVSGSYIFVLGQADVAADKGPTSSSQNFSTKQILIYLARFLFYLSLLTLAGWMFWKFIQREEPSMSLSTYDQRWGIRLQLIFFISFLLMVATELQELLSSWDMQSFASLLLHTRIGNSWLGTLILSVSGFIFLHRNKTFLIFWTILILGVKVFNGHAMTFEPRNQMMMLDFIHLFAASIWVGGLVYIVLHLRSYRETVNRFLPKFSQLALFSMIILTLSGIFYTVGILPKFTYIFYTTWGILLLIKATLILLVLITGALLRYVLKRNALTKSDTLIRIDVTLMALIVLIVGVFTYMNPIPLNKPLSWHESSSKGDILLNISPNTPGKNVFSLTAHGPSSSNAVPKYVHVYMKYLDDDSVAPIEVPFQQSSDKPASFSAEGHYLPFPGKWHIEVRVMDTNDDESVYNHTVMIFRSL